MPFSVKGCKVIKALLVARIYITTLREYPNLKKRTGFGLAGIVFGVHQSCSGAHGLHFPHSEHLLITHRVLMLQCSRQGNRDNLHVVVRMLAKARSAGNPVVIEHA